MIEPTVVTWIGALLACSVIPKIFGIFLRDRDLGMVAGPALGVFGGIVLWQVAIEAGYIGPADLVAAVATASFGCLLLYLPAVVLKNRNR